MSNPLPKRPSIHKRVQSSPDQVSVHRKRSKILPRRSKSILTRKQLLRTIVRVQLPRRHASGYVTLACSASTTGKFIKDKIDNLNRILFKVKAQIEDSAFSVHSNITEGYCRRHIKENIQFNNIALASLGENYSQIYSLFYTRIIDEKCFNEYDSLHYSLKNKLISYNRLQIKQLKEKFECP